MQRVLTACSWCTRAASLCPCQKQSCPLSLTPFSGHKCLARQGPFVSLEDSYVLYICWETCNLLSRRGSGEARSSGWVSRRGRRLHVYILPARTQDSRARDVSRSPMCCSFKVV